VQASALTGEGLDELKGRIAKRFAERLRPVRLLVPYDEGRILAELYELGAPIDERLDTAEGVIVLAQLPQREVPRFAPYLVAEPAASAPSRNAAPLLGREHQALQGRRESR
jgi:GTP-binding protein HflX